ncbi:MAG: M20/M25/M40 family metallo-hydrolase [Peptococcaceae bacterium]|nr:M20/M25/M40 family metallo-hydrolase [Peptococcaceae bacterium]
MIEKHLHELAEVIGARGSATLGEKRAADYAAGQLAQWGYQVTMQPFRALTTFSWLYITLYLWPLLGWFLGWWWFSLLGAMLFFLELNTVETISRFIPKGQSQNVIARHPQGSGAQVVLVAHLDSSKAGLNFSPKMVKNFRVSFLAMVGSMFVAPLLLLIASIYGGAWYYVALIPCLYLLTICATLLHREIWNFYTPGANDNASGVAAVLEVAERLKENLPSDIDLTVLLTGCEESGTYGMSRFLDASGSEYRNAWFINLDNIGRGTVHYMAGEGMFPVYRSSPEILAACQAVAAARPALAVRQGVYNLLSTDALPALRRGYRAISFLSLDDEGLLPNWHWPTDTVANVDVATVEKAVEFVSELLKNVSESTKKKS